MDGDFVKQKWARAAVAKLTGIIKEWNALPDAKRNKMYVAWGHPDAEIREAESDLPKTLKEQHGLLGFGDHEVELNLYRHAVSDEIVYVRIYRLFGEPHVLPLKPRELFNVLMSCAESVRLIILGDYESNEILASGISSVLPLEGMTGAMLATAVLELLISDDVLYERLADKKGTDFWEDGKDFV